MLNEKQLEYFKTIPTDIASLTDIKVVGKRMSADGKEIKDDAKKQSNGKIEDFGVKIGGARKDEYARFIHDFESMRYDDFMTQPLSKSWPVPNYQKLLDAGIEPWKVAALRGLREAIPHKPAVKKSIYKCLYQLILQLKTQ